jgi:aspartyl/asparaginyl beta-hydroxylase (cupin superfamily)
MTEDPAALVKEADAALGAGQVDRAADLLERAASYNQEDPGLWLRLSALHRAAGRFDSALAATTRALKADPLDFMALLVRASLLDRMGDPDAGEAWDNALSQKPDGPLPAQVQAAVAQGERKRDSWLDQREQALAAAMADSEARAEPDARQRIARFRTNVLRRTQPFRSSPTHYLFPELREREFHQRRDFPWLEQLEAATETIAAEFAAVMAAERSELVPYIQYDEHLPLDQWRPLNHNPDWTAIHLINRGATIDANARHCPATMDLLARLPQPDIVGAGPNAMFSLLAPNTHIPPHVGVSNCRLVCHLPLIVPPGCWFRVGAQTINWERGHAFVFDDTIEHEAKNPSGELRVVFIFDIWHPDLSEIERTAVKTLIEADKVVRAQPL